MKGSKKVPLKSAPVSKGRQFIKVKYGADESSEPSLSASKAMGGISRKSCGVGVGAPTSRPSMTATSSSSPLNSKAKPKVNVANSSAKSNGLSACKRIPSTGHPFEKSASNNNIFKDVAQQKRPVPRKGECEICRQPCRSHCAGCKRVFYCSKQHQQQDWSNHKLTCRPFSIPTQYSSGFPSAAGASSSASFSSSNRNISASSTNLSPELQYMISTKNIPAGSVLFIEKPLLVVANVFVQPTPGIWCCNCLKPIPNSGDVANNNEASHFCPICDVPLCDECFVDIGKADIVTELKKLHGGQGHYSEECALISDICQKTPDVLSFRRGEHKGPTKLMKDLALLRILMFRTSSPWRWESLLALRNSPRYNVSCKHSLSNLDGWITYEEYPIANHYLKNICKEKNFQLEDIAKIVAVFCEVSVKNPNLLVLYENLSWLAHACTPNAEMFFRQENIEDDATIKDDNRMEIVVKAVNMIGEGCKVTRSHLANFEGGRSALALKLFQSKGHFCCDSECACYQSRTLDKTLGIRCNLVFTGSGHACSGILSPRVDAPNPSKANLGLGVFVKSKKWECDKCKKSEKYESLHSKIMQVAQELASACDRCCNIDTGDEKTLKSQQSFLQLQNKLLSNLSDQHWMVWKAKLRILKTWTTSVGYGHQMLRILLAHYHVAAQDLVQTVKQKIDMYGNGIYLIDEDDKTGKSQTKMGVLELYAKRHGKLSPKRGHLLFDAFFANFIILLEDYKRELPLPPGQSSLKRHQVAREYTKKLAVLCGILEQTQESLRMTEGTTLAPATAKSLKLSKDILEIVRNVSRKVEQRPHLIVVYLCDLVQVACVDSDLVQSCVKKSQHTNEVDPSDVDIALSFEVESVNLEEGATMFSFGAINSSATCSPKDDNGPMFSFGATSNIPTFGFSSFGSPGFGTSDADSSSDLDEADCCDDNPFIYSRTPRNDNKSRYYSGDYNRGSNSSKSSSTTKGQGEGEKKGGDWSSYFWLSSDDTDDEFDIGFTSSPRSTFGSDLFNDAELEDLAEWAAMQFMMGKMNI